MAFYRYCILENENGVTTYVDNVFTTCIGMTSGLKVDLMQQFEKVYQNLSIIYSDKEPLINMITWYGLDKISHFGGDEKDGKLAHDGRRAAIRARVEASKLLSSLAPSSIGVRRLASCLPSSTPH